MSNVYSLRIYDTELMRFSMEKQGLSGLVAEILYVNEEQAHLLPLDMERSSEGVIHWLERRAIPKNRAFVDEILKTLGLSRNDTRGIIDVCKGLFLNDSYWKEQLRHMIGFRFRRHPSLNLPEEHLRAIEKHLESRVRKLLAIPAQH